MELERHNQDLAQTQVRDTQIKLDLMRDIHAPSSQRLIKNFAKETPDLAQKLFPDVYNNLNPNEQAKLCQVINEYKTELNKKGASHKIWEALDIIKPNHLHGSRTKVPNDGRTY